MKVLSKFFDEIKNKIGYYPETIQCNNARENYSLQKHLKEKGQPTKFEFIPREMLQHNGVVERAFATLYRRVQAMMNHARLDLPKQQELWTKAAATATKLDNITIKTVEETHPYKKFYNKRMLYKKHLCIFGEIGVITNKNQGIKNKISGHGKKCMLVGYAKDHNGDVYWMLDYCTRNIYLTQDITWTKSTYPTKTNNQPYFVEMELKKDDQQENNNKEEEIVLFEHDD